MKIATWVIPIMSQRKNKGHHKDSLSGPPMIYIEIMRFNMSKLLALAKEIFRRQLAYIIQFKRSLHSHAPYGHLGGKLLPITDSLLNIRKKE